MAPLLHSYMGLARFPGDGNDGKLFTFRYMGRRITWQRGKSEGIREALASTSSDKNSLHSFARVQSSGDDVSQRP